MGSFGANGTQEETKVEANITFGLSYKQLDGNEHTVPTDIMKWPQNNTKNKQATPSETLHHWFSKAKDEKPN